jgi:hypothetical protein
MVRDEFMKINISPHNMMQSIIETFAISVAYVKGQWPGPGAAEEERKTAVSKLFTTTKLNLLFLSSEQQVSQQRSVTLSMLKF